MKAEDIREGDIVEIDYIAEFTKEHKNEGTALVIWQGFHNQPLVRMLNINTNRWTVYEHIARVVGHIDIDDVIDKALKMEECKVNSNQWNFVGEQLPTENGTYRVIEKSGRVCTYVFRKEGNSEEYWKRCAVAWKPL